jgi:hypothetical protein
VGTERQNKNFKVMSNFIMDRKELVKNQIKKMIETNSVQFKDGSTTVDVVKVSNVSITSPLKEINQDNPDLDNYEFEGIAELSITGNPVTQTWRIKGTAKVKDAQPIDIQIKEPIPIYKLH